MIIKRGVEDFISDFLFSYRKSDIVETGTITQNGTVMG